MTLQEEIKELLDPETQLPFPVTRKSDSPWETIRIQNALIRIAARIDKQDELMQSIYKTSEKILAAIGAVDERVDELADQIK